MTIVWIALFLVVSYAAFAPLFFDREDNLLLDSVFLSVAIAMALCGPLSMLAAIGGFNGKYPIVLLYFLLAFVNLRLFGKKLIPKFGMGNLPPFFFLAVLFFVWAGSSFVASIKMGVGDYPHFFLDADTPKNLTHAHQMLDIESYPPESLITKGVQVPYHYGAPASASVLSSITGVSVHKAMFWILSPSLLLGSFFGLVLLIRQQIFSQSNRMLAMALFVPFVRLGQETYWQIFYSFQAYGVAETFLRMVNSFLGTEVNALYRPEIFGNGIWNVSVSTGMFLIILSALVLTHARLRAILLIPPVLLIVGFFSKIAVLPTVIVMCGIRALYEFRELRLSRIFLLTVFNGGLLLLMVIVSGILDPAQNVTTLNTYDKAVSILNFRRWENRYLLELLGVLVIVSVGLVLLMSNKKKSAASDWRLITGTCTTAIICVLTTVVISLPKASSQFFQPLWIAVPLLCTLLISHWSGAVWRKLLIIVIILPVFATASLALWNKLQHLVVVAHQPEYAQEYVNNKSVGELLKKVPTKTSVLATNDFGLFGFVNHQTQLTALFGHQFWAVSSSLLGFFRSHEMLAVADERLRLQRERLSSDFVRQNSGFSKETLALAKENGWTHFLLKKSVPKTIFQSNSICWDRVGGDNEDQCRNDASTENKFMELTRLADATTDQRLCGPGEPAAVGVGKVVFPLELIQSELAVNNQIRNISVVYQGPTESKVLSTSDGGLIVVLPEEKTSRSKNLEELPLLVRNLTLFLYSCDDVLTLSQGIVKATVELTRSIQYPVFSNIEEVPLQKIDENNEYALFLFL